MPGLPHTHRSVMYGQRFIYALVAFCAALSWPGQALPLSSPQSDDIRSLTAGQPIERELSGGQPHNYAITLAAGQYLQLTVAQRGIDVALRVFDPAGQQLLESDGPGGAQSTETAALVAEADGIYRLRISAVAPNAAAGKYVVQMDELRMATQRERDETAGQRKLEEATRLMAQGAKDKFALAAERFTEARALFQRANDPAGEGNALNFLGMIRLMQGDARNAIEPLTQAWEIQRQRADSGAENLQAKAALLGNLAVAHNQLGQTLEAAERLKQALPLMLAAQNKGGEAKLLASLGSVHHTLGLLQQAQTYFTQAVERFRALNDQGSEGVALNNLGTLYRHLGEAEPALTAYQQALPLLRAAGDKRVEAIALDNLGVLRRATGDFTQAVQLFEQALALRRALGDQRGAAISLDNLGVAYREQGNAAKALELQTEALRLLQAAGDAHRSAITLDNLGLTYRKLNNVPRALESHRQALPLLESVGDQLVQAGVLKNLAVLEREQGQLAAARADIEHAITRLEFLRANVHSQETRASFLATVADYFELNTDILMRLHAAEPQAGHALAALQRTEQGRARSLLELLNESRADLRTGVNAALLERERTLKTRLTAKLDALTRLPATPAAQPQRLATQKEISELTDEYRRVQAEIRQTSPRYAALTQPQPLNASQIQQLLDEDTLLLEYALGEKASYVWAVTSVAVNSFTLPPRAEIENAARLVYEKLRTRPGRGPVGDAQFVAQAKKLSQMLLGPVATLLNQKRLAIVASGALAYLPFAALPIPEIERQGDREKVKQHMARGKTVSSSLRLSVSPSPLLASHEIVNLPSASALSVIRRETQDRKAASQTLAVIADPVFEANDPRVTAARNELAMPAALTRALKATNARAGLTRLAFSRQEAEAIYAIAPRNAAMKATDFTASRATAMSEPLSQYRLLHFATHGLLNNEQPELSGLVFSLVDEKGNAQDGFLRLHEVFNLKLNADLVVLSACETGLGKEIKGEGLIGLTRGFMYAGVPRVVASLWNVDDLATAELMKLFYRGMLKNGLRPAAALRAAQRDLARQPRWAAPYFWAGFVLQGEWK